MSNPPPIIRLPDGSRSQDDETPTDPEPPSATGVASSSNAEGPSNASSSGRPRSPTSSDTPASLGNPARPNTASAAKKGSLKLTRKDTGGKDGKDAKNGPGNTPTDSPSPSAIDPISHHIFVRTNTDKAIPSKLRNIARPETPANQGSLPRPSEDPASKQVAVLTEQAKEKKRGSGFLGRLSMIGGKKKDDDDDDDSELNEQRLEGADAVAFSSATGGAGYIPHHKEPPRYIKVRAHNKKAREFNRMFLAQELTVTQPASRNGEEKAPNGHTPTTSFGRKPVASGDPIYAMEFSRDGKYLATGGRDQVVRIWAVISTPEERNAYEEAGDGSNGDGQRLSTPVFHPEPIKSFAGHTGEILDLSWSKNNFLLSTAMDKTVRLWHVSRQECLCTFKHKDFVTSIAFHPRDDRFFLAGSLDSILRLWSIPDKAVAYSSQLTDLITAVAFSPDGKTSIAGCLNGFCTFYDTEGLKFLTQIHVRSTRGKNAKGSKITGIQTMAFPPDASDADVKVLVTSNDSRIRVYNLRDKTEEMKVKGHENVCNQIKARFSDDGRYIVCGSEDHKAFIWSTGPVDAENKDKRPYEYFEAHADIVTQAIIAPTATRQLLQASHDPIFTLCNPPPVTLLSREESIASQAGLPEDLQSEILSHVKKPEESPAYIARSRHTHGNIIVTADHSGMLKVFRQDCAFAKRRIENWDTGSTFSRKLGKDGLLGRTGSIMTRTSASSRDPHSRRGSLSQPPQGFAQAQLGSDRIISWRQGIENGHGHGRPNSISIAVSTPTRSERSISPSKPPGSGRTPMTSSAVNLASEARRQPYANASPSIVPASPPVPVSPTIGIGTLSLNTSPKKAEGKLEKSRSRDAEEQKPAAPPTPSFTFRPADEDEDSLRLDPAGASYSFWNLSRWRTMAGLRGNNTNSPTSPGKDGNASNDDPSTQGETGPATPDKEKSRRKSFGANATSTDSTEETSKANRRKSLATSTMLGEGESPGQLAPPNILGNMDRSGSIVSRLSSELTSDDGEASGEEMQCSKCGNRDFKAKKVGGKQRFLCSRCGRMVDA